MKFKEYKIRIPEHDFLRNVLRIGDDIERIDKTVDRHEIHELVQKHAFKLGYNWCNRDIVKNKDCEYLYFSKYATIIGGLTYETYTEAHEQEIHWTDFLKLTEDDVILREWNHVGVESDGSDDTKIPYFSYIKTDEDLIHMDSPIATKVGQHIIIGNDRYIVDEISYGAIGCRKVSASHKRRIKLSMEVD